MAGEMPLHPDDPQVLGGYALIARLGAGGQGVVYLGRGTEPGAPARVAIKLLHGQLIEDSAARMRFVRELSVVQRVAGFCTAQVLAADVAGDRPYIITEYVPGPSLQELVNQEGPRHGTDLYRLAIGTVTALTAIHRAGIVHRDFKPPNVLMAPDGPRVIDFGIARALDTSTNVTSQLIGTPSYMAPEQMTETDVGSEVDLFAWAVTMLYAATGRPPFGGGPIAAVALRIMQDTPDVSELPGTLAEVAEACLAKDPKARPHADQVLLRLLGTEPVGGTMTGGPPPVTTMTDPMGTMPAPWPTAGLANPAPTPVAAPLPPPMPPPGFTPEPPMPAPSFTPEPPMLTQGVSPGAQPYPAQDVRGPAVMDERPPAPKRVTRTVTGLAGLVIAALSGSLDLVTIGILLSSPASQNTQGPYMLAATGFALLGVITLLAVALSWIGTGRRAAWTVIGSRLTRAALWGVWASTLSVRLDAVMVNVLPPLAVTALLGWSLWRTRTRRGVRR